MSERVQFFQTRMGMRHYEHTMPELVKQLTRLNDLIERLIGPVDRDRPQDTWPNPSNPPTATTRTEP